MKHLIKSLLLTMLVALVSISASAADYDFEVDGVYYNILSLSDLTCEVTKGDVKYTGDVKIPSTVTYNGKKLSVTSIGADAFEYCTSLTSIDIPNSVTTIGNDAFEYCTSLTSIDIPNSVTSIGYDAFYYCESLTSIDISNSVTSIGSSAFDYCRGLKAVYIHDLVAWCNIKFYDESANPLMYASNLYINNALATDIKIPNDVTNIGSYTFSGCTSLTSIDIPNSVTSIGSYAFSGCTSLTSIDIPNSVTSMGICAILGTSIKELTIGNGIDKLPYNFYLRSGGKNKDGYYEYSLLFSSHGTVPYNDTHPYEKYSYDICDSIKKIVFEDSKDTLYLPTFMERGYGSVTVADGVWDINILPTLNELYIGRNLETYCGLSSFYKSFHSGFWECYSTVIQIKNKNVKRIEYGDFVTAENDVSGCTSLEEIVYGKGISSIKTSNISGGNLTAIYVKSDTPPTVSGTFTNKTYMNAKLYVPKESLEEYKKADVWKDFWNIEGYDFSSGISNITVDKANKPDVIYDLQGRKLSEPQKGINIINGKKVVVR